MSVVVVILVKRSRSSSTANGSSSEVDARGIDVANGVVDRVCKAAAGFITDAALGVEDLGAEVLLRVSTEASGSES